jgi:predicted transcriptional regulator
MATTMSKKKPADRSEDRHASTRMVRLPVEWHEALKALAREQDRSLTRELLRAVAAHLKAHGKEPPPMP